MAHGIGLQFEHRPRRNPPVGHDVLGRAIRPRGHTGDASRPGGIGRQHVPSHIGSSWHAEVAFPSEALSGFDPRGNSAHTLLRVASGDAH